MKKAGTETRHASFRFWLCHKDKHILLAIARNWGIHFRRSFLSGFDPWQGTWCIMLTMTETLLLAPIRSPHNKTNIISRHNKAETEAIAAINYLIGPILESLRITMHRWRKRLLQILLGFLQTNTHVTFLLTPPRRRRRRRHNQWRQKMISTLYQDFRCRSIYNRQTTSIAHNLTH